MEMNAFTLKIALAAMLTAMALTSCLKRKDYPPTPVIEYTDFIKYGSDSAEFVFRFTDGDGDVGLGEGDTTGNFARDKRTYYNLIMTYYFRDTSGNFVPFDSDPSSPDTLDTLVYAYRIPDITPIGQNKVLDGEMRVRLMSPYYAPGHQVFRYDAYIYDRSLKKSNVIQTPQITP